MGGVTPRKTLQSPAQFQPCPPFLWSCFILGGMGRARTGVKFWIERLVVNPQGNVVLRGPGFSPETGLGVTWRPVWTPLPRLLTVQCAGERPSTDHITLSSLHFFPPLPYFLTSSPPTFPMHRNQIFWQSQASCTPQNQPHHFILNKQDAPSGALKRIFRGLFAEMRVGQKEAVVLRTPRTCGEEGRRQCYQGLGRV